MAKGGCCKILFIVAVVVGIAVVTGVLVWHFALPEDSKEFVQDVFNNTGGDGGVFSGGGDDDNGSGSNGNGGGGDGPVLDYDFLQCNDNSTTDTTVVTCCNGLTGLCDLRVDEILYGYVHNAVATDQDDFNILVNHDYNLENALKAGFRAMELDVGRCGFVNEEVVFFHAQCLLGSRDIASTLTNINTFLDENPNEVIILKLEMADESVTLQEVADIMDTVATGSFRDRLYQKQDAAAAWPTLGELVALDQRIILFYYNQPDCANQNCPTGFHFWFTFGVNTQFSFDDVADLEATDTSCVLTGAGANSQRDFFRVNAFVSVPSRQVADTVNAENFMVQRMQDCAALNQDLAVNFYSVDFWERGDVPRTVQEYNRNLIDNAAARKRRRTAVRRRD
jgi:hypothetical protein